MATAASGPIRTRSSALSYWYRLALLLLALDRSSPASSPPCDALRTAMGASAQGFRSHPVKRNTTKPPSAPAPTKQESSNLFHAKLSRGRVFCVYSPIRHQCGQVGVLFVLARTRVPDSRRALTPAWIASAYARCPSTFRGRLLSSSCTRRAPSVRLVMPRQAVRVLDTTTRPIPAKLRLVEGPACCQVI